ncbi:MAG: twin-arginine translocase subunit TatB [Rhizobiales bacterium]|nr:twin-arginine translocase subunit TatB [Hyphomicrobiales bacterium]
MFDISWTEFLLIGIVALIVIGPKELPAVMRSLGQWTRKIRSLAADFQNQFHEAMREAEMADLKKQVDDMASDIKQYDPLKDVRADVEAIGKDLDESVKSPDKAASAEATKEKANTPDSAATTTPAEPFPIPQASAELSDQEVAGVGVAPKAPEAAAESTSSGGAGKPQ